MKIHCSQCKTKFEYFESKYRPFCSERCKQVDLGKWLTESYAIEAEPASIESEQFGDEEEI